MQKKTIRKLIFEIPPLYSIQNVTHDDKVERALRKIRRKK